VTSRWFSPCTPVSSTNKTDRHISTEKLLKVALNTMIVINAAPHSGVKSTKLSILITLYVIKFETRDEDSH
jgi:hypothetical protein